MKPQKERQSVGFIMQFIGGREIFWKAKVSSIGRANNLINKFGRNLSDAERLIAPLLFRDWN